MLLLPSKVGGRGRARLSKSGLMPYCSRGASWEFTSNACFLPASMELILTGTVGLADLSPTYIHYLLLYLIIYRYAKVAKAYIDR